MQNMSRAIGALLGLFFSVNLFVACVEKDFDSTDPAEAFAAARRPYDNRHFDIALQRLGSFKSRFPYSQHAALAELLIANSHFELRQYQEAAMSYQHFIRLHPRHAEVEFAMYRIGKAYWTEAPKAIDREQDYTHRALEEWRKLVQRFPDGDYARQARELIGQGERRIAESLNFIVNFYCKQRIWHACAYRSIQLMDEYPHFKDLRLNAINKAALAFERMARLHRRDPEDDSNIFYQSMTSDELAAKAKTFRDLAKKTKTES